MGWTWHRRLLYQSEDHRQVIDGRLRANPKWMNGLRRDGAVGGELTSCDENVWPPRLIATTLG